MRGGRYGQTVLAIAKVEERIRKRASEEMKYKKVMIEYLPIITQFMI